MQSSSSIDKCAKKVKSLEKFNVKYKKEITELKSKNQNLTSVNESLQDEIFFLKRFIQDMSHKNDIAQKENSNYVFKLQSEIDKSKESIKGYYEDNKRLTIDNNELNNFNKELEKEKADLVKVNNEYKNDIMILLKKLEDNIAYVNGIKKGFKNVFKKLYMSQKENTLIKQEYSLLSDEQNKLSNSYRNLSDDYNNLSDNYNDLSDNYVNLSHEYKVFRRDLEQSLEESVPLLGDNQMSQLDKIRKYSSLKFDNFTSKKKIENKKNNKDNISFINKPMSKFSNEEGLPTLFSVIDDFFSPPKPPQKQKPSKGWSNPKAFHEAQQINHDIAIENSKLHDAVDKLNSKLNKKCADNEELNRKLSKRDNECDNLRYKLESLKGELMSLQKSMTQPSNAKENLMTVMLGGSVNQNETEIVKKQYSQLKKQHMSIEKQYTELKAQYDTLMKQNVYEPNKIKDLERQIMQLTKENKAFKKQFDLANQTYANCNVQNNNKLVNYQAMISTQQKTIDEYKTKYSNLMKSYEKEQEKHALNISKMAHHEWSDANYKLNIAELEKTVDSKIAELEKLKEENEFLKSNDRKFTGIQLECVELEKENSDLRNEVIELNDKLSNCVVDNKDMVEYVKVVEGDLDKLIKEHDELIEDYQGLLEENDEHNVSIKKLNAKLDALKDENKRLCHVDVETQKLNDLIAQMAIEQKQLEEQVININQEAGQLQNEVNGFNDTYNAMKEKMGFDIVERDEIISNMDDEIKSLKDINNGLTKLLDQKDAERKANYVLRGEYDALEADYEALSNNHQDNLAEKEDLEKAVITLESETRDLIDEYNEINDEVEQLRYLNDDMILKNESLDKANNKLSVEYTKLSDQLSELKWNNDELSDNYKELHEENKIALKEKRDAEECLAETQRLRKIAEQDLYNCNEMLVKKEAEYEKLQKKSTSNDKYVEALLDTHKALNNDHMLLKSKYNSSKKMNESLEDKYSVLVIENGNLVEENNQLTKQVNELSKQNTEMKPIYEKFMNDWDIVNDIDFQEKNEEQKVL